MAITVVLLQLHKHQSIKAFLVDPFKEVYNDEFTFEYNKKGEKKKDNIFASSRNLWLFHMCC